LNNYFSLQQQQAVEDLDEDEEEIPDEWKEEGFVKTCIPMTSPESETWIDDVQDRNIVSNFDVQDRNDVSNFDVQERNDIWNDVIEEEEDVVDASIMETPFNPDYGKESRSTLVENLMESLSQELKIEDQLLESFQLDDDSSLADFEEQEKLSIVEVDQRELTVSAMSDSSLNSVGKQLNQISDLSDSNVDSGANHLTEIADLSFLSDPDVDSEVKQMTKIPDISYLSDPIIESDVKQMIEIPDESIGNNSSILMDSLMPIESIPKASLESISVSSQLISFRAGSESLMIEDSLDPRPQFTIEHLHSDDFVSMNEKGLNNNNNLLSIDENQMKFNAEQTNFLSSTRLSPFEPSQEESIEASLASFIRKEKELEKGESASSCSEIMDAETLSSLDSNLNEIIPESSLEITDEMVVIRQEETKEHSIHLDKSDVMNVKEVSDTISSESLSLPNDESKIRIDNLKPSTESKNRHQESMKEEEHFESGKDRDIESPKMIELDAIKTTRELDLVPKLYPEEVTSIKLAENQLSGKSTLSEPALDIKQPVSHPSRTPTRNESMQESISPPTNGNSKQNHLDKLQDSIELVHEEENSAQTRTRSCSPNSSSIPVRDMAKIFESSFPAKSSKQTSNKSSLSSSSWKSMPNLSRSQPKQDTPPIKKTSKGPAISSAIPVEEKEACTLVPIKERKKMFEAMAMKEKQMRQL